MSTGYEYHYLWCPDCCKCWFVAAVGMNIPAKGYPDGKGNIVTRCRRCEREGVT